MTLIDERDFHTFQPLLYEVASAGLNPNGVAYPFRAVFGGNSSVRFCLGRVTRIDMEHAVGDVRAGSVKRVVAAIGKASGCVASVHAFLAFGEG